MCYPDIDTVECGAPQIRVRLEHCPFRAVGVAACLR